MILDANEMQQCEDAIMDGVCEGTCNKCGNTQPVEPDGDYSCPECNEGRVQSVLMKHGLI